MDSKLFDKSEVLKLTSSTVLNVVLLVDAFIRAPSLIVNPYLRSGWSLRAGTIWKTSKVVSDGVVTLGVYPKDCAML